MCKICKSVGFSLHLWGLVEQNLARSCGNWLSCWMLLSQHSVTNFPFSSGRASGRWDSLRRTDSVTSSENFSRALLLYQGCWSFAGFSQPLQTKIWQLLTLIIHHGSILEKTLPNQRNALTSYESLTPAVCVSVCIFLCKPGNRIAVKGNGGGGKRQWQGPSWLLNTKLTVLLFRLILSFRRERWWPQNCALYPTNPVQRSPLPKPVLGWRISLNNISEE